MPIGLAWRVIKDETLRGIYLACFFFFFFFFFFITLEPRVEWYTGLCALNTSPPRNSSHQDFFHGVEM